MCPSLMLCAFWEGVRGSPKTADSGGSWMAASARAGWWSSVLQEEGPRAQLEIQAQRCPRCPLDPACRHAAVSGVRGAPASHWLVLISFQWISWKSRKFAQGRTLRTSSAQKWSARRKTAASPSFTAPISSSAHSVWQVGARLSALLPLSASVSPAEVL